MPASKPEECDLLIAKAINDGDADAGAALYEADAVYMLEPGRSIKGTAAIREALSQFIATKPKLSIEVPITLQNGDLAITISHWTITSTDAGGKATTMSGRGTEVVRRQADGSWKFTIDHPTAASCQ
jgi:uncharacterized protein (TIGR02246 family)